MAWFQLDPENIAARAKACGAACRVPSLAASMGRGMIGFAIVSVAGFVPWAVFGRWFHRIGGELGMYLACALVFIGASGWLLHRLIIGPGSLSRFSKLFAISFASYSAGWIAGWMLLRGHPGSLAGLLAGTAVMGWMLTRAFDAHRTTLKVIAILFVLNSIGYFAGGWAEGVVMGMKELALLGTVLPRKSQMILAMLLWGVGYGLGFGAGLGWAFHVCQNRARALLSEMPPTPPASS